MVEVQIQHPVDSVRSDANPHSLSFGRITNQNIKRLTDEERKNRCADIINFIAFIKNRIRKNKKQDIPLYKKKREEYREHLRRLVTEHKRQIENLSYNIEIVKDPDSLKWLKKELETNIQNAKNRESYIKESEEEEKQFIQNLEQELKNDTKHIAEFTSSYETFCSENPDRVKKVQRTASDPPKPPEVPWVLSKYDDNALNTAGKNLESKKPNKIDSASLIKGQTYYVLDPGNRYNGKYTFPAFATYARDARDNIQGNKVFNIYRMGKYIIDDMGPSVFPREGSEPDDFVLDTTVLEFYHPRISLNSPPTDILSAGGNKRKNRSSNKTSKLRVKTKTKSRRRRNNISSRRKQRR